MRCPHCQTEPPRDPFVCAHCGEHLLTYLDEPLGPGTGVRLGAPGEGVGARAAGATGEPRTGGFAGGPLPAGTMAGPDQGSFQQGQPAEARRPDNTGPFILNLLFGLFVTVVLLAQETLAGVLFLIGLALALWRWPRARLLPFGLILVGVAATIWVAIELVDAIDAPPRFMATSTPTPDRAATSTAVAIAGTPTLAPAARTATATVIAGENRVKLSRARARWLRGDNVTALAELDDALTLIPGLAETLNLRALVRIASGDSEGALADAERAVTAQPSNVSYRDTRGYALLKVGRYEAAASDYDRVLAASRSASHVAAYLGRGIARTAQGRLVEARMDLETGLRLAPDLEPDPQLADLETAARRALDSLASGPGLSSPSASPGVRAPPAPVASPTASPVALRVAAPLQARGERGPLP